jgi:membrane associated rhomboid family serine protease
MIPLRDVHKPQRVPFITWLLMLVNAGFFLWQVVQAQGDAQSTLVATLGVRPHCYISPTSCGIEVLQQSEKLWQPLFGSLFLHGGWLHLAFNLLFLWVFGPGVEDKLGRPKYLLFYLGCGVFATLSHIFTHPFSTVPVIGASGAIAGVLGAHLLLLPRSWILTYFPPIFLFPVPAPLFLVLWIAGQVAGGLGVLPGGVLSPQSADVAWMAHIGGFAAGVALTWRARRWGKRRKSKAATVA